MFKRPGLSSVLLAGIFAIAGGSVFGDENEAGAGPVLQTLHKDNALLDEGFTAQRMAELETKVVGARQRLTRVKQMLSKAKNTTDTLKVTCLDDKASKLKANIAGVDERFAAAKTAFRDGDRKLAALHAGALDVSFAKAAQTEADADACISDTDVVLGESETSVSTSRGSADDNKGTDADEQRVDTNQPSQASPVL